MVTNTCKFIINLVLISIVRSLYSFPVDNIDHESKMSEPRPRHELTKQINQNCSENEEYVKCKPCELTCDGEMVSCSRECKSGCFCKLFRNREGRCVSFENCSRQMKHNSAMFLNMSPFSHTSIEECALDEVFSSCGWCEASCADPEPRCPPSCVRGCLCRPSLLRHHSGHCVKREDCLPRKCTNPNEEYSCRHGCEERCVRRPCARQTRCQLGCHCRRGMLRDNQGRCVTRDQCDKE